MFLIHTYVENISIIFTFLYPLHLPSPSQHGLFYIIILYHLSVCSLFSGVLSWYFTHKYVGFLPIYCANLPHMKNHYQTKSHHWIKELGELYTSPVARTVNFLSPWLPGLLYSLFLQFLLPSLPPPGTGIWVTYCFLIFYVIFLFLDAF
jgi:hypothetical protein